MNGEIHLKVRAVLNSFKPYEWEPTAEAISAEFGIEAERVLRFDTNTLPFIPSKVLSELSNVLSNLKVNEYPDTSYASLRESISKYTSASIDQISVTNGADEALDIIVKTFVDAGSIVVTSEPTYSMYRVTAEIMGGKVIQVPRNRDFSDDVDSVIRTAKEARSIFLCSPNNPTGNSTRREDVTRLLREVDLPVVVDESYFEFCGKTVADLVKKHENLIVVRTLSKAFGLAGIRVGYVLANLETIKALNRVRPPNSVGVISAILAKFALENVSYMRKNVEFIIGERERLVRALKELDALHVYPSEANFILIKFKHLSGSEAHKKLLRLGIVTRDVSSLPMLKHCIRVTVRNPDENNKLLEALGKITS
ncbi:MAG: histidinol-phosphate transaminase [Candidatus Bathyarchaeia archaeon]